MDTTNSMQLCRICISSNSNCTQMISIFGEDSLWKKITTLANVKIEKDDTLPQQVCVACAKTAISACLFKKKCEDADNFFRQQLLIQKIENSTSFANSQSRSSIENGMLQDQHKESLDLTENDLSSCDEKDDVNAQHISGTEIGDDGEIKSMNDKPVPFDINSIRMMHEYMQQQLNTINGVHSGQMNNGASGSEAAGDDEEPLPLIPEIELITPSEEIHVMQSSNGVEMTEPIQNRGYQCPSCFQIFEMKQILKAHMQSVHGTPGPVYECSNCKKTYFYKRFLEKHIRRGRCVKKRRNQTRPMQCSDCFVLFPTGHHLGWHKRTGCPSRAAKMPLQQLFKQNIVQYNNFPRRIGVRKPENAIYLHNRKLIMANKRKGRTRIKLDAKKIALAKQLILREATTTVIANELNISRTFAWRLRKSLVNGVSLHERVIEPNPDEITESAAASSEQATRDPTMEIVDDVVESEKLQVSNDDDCEDNNTDEENERETNIASSFYLNNGEEQKYRNSIDSQAKEHLIDNIEKNETDDNESINLNITNNSQSMQHEHEEKQNFNQNRTTCTQNHNSDELLFHGKAHSLAVPGLSIVNPQFPPTVPAPIHQLPVNLSIRQVAAVQQNSGMTNKSQTKKPRKPNVFIDDEKYAMAKLLVAQNASTMEIARALNVSQMTAWKVRDAIVKGVPLSYRNKRDAVRSHSVNDGKIEDVLQPKLIQAPKAQQEQLLQQHHERHLEILKHHQQMQQIQPIHQQQGGASIVQAPQSILTSLQNHHQPAGSASVKVPSPRRRLKAAERELRDKEITREILELIKEDSNIQYWKVSARLAEKGYPISPSSVCQKLKSMGIHRRWKPGDKPPMLNVNQLKAAGFMSQIASNSSSAEEESYEPRFDMGGAHFLSAFTH